MEALSTDDIDASTRRTRSTLALWVVFLLCYLPYPMALLIPTRCGVDYRYDIALPVVLWASVIALAGFARLAFPSRAHPGGEKLAATAVWRRPWFKTAATCTALVLVFALLVRWRMRGVPLAEIVQFAGLFAIPLYVALAPDSRMPRHFGGVVAGLWLVHALHGVQQMAIGWQVLGVAGNRNWAAAMLAATAPWAWKAVVGRRQERSYKILWACLVGGITLLLLWQTRSRAAFLAVGGYGLFYVALARGSRLWRLAVVALVALALAALVSLEGQAVRRNLARDIRGPLWLGTLDMIADYPLAGVGPGNFRRDFANYRLSWQMRSPKAAPVTLHPHNEWLHIAAVGGLPLALLWAALLVCLTWPGKNAFFPRAVHFSAFVLIVCGMLDLTLFMAPTALLALIILGWHIRGTLGWRLLDNPAPSLCPAPSTDDNAPAAKPCLPCPLIKLGGGALLVLVAGLHTGAVLHSGWNMREARLAELSNDFERAHENYLLAHAAWPRNLEALYNAVEIALLKLRNPQLAVLHGESIRRRDPSLAHINGLMATAYEQLGDARNALKSFRQEANLFPYDASIQGKALDRFLRAGDLTAALETRRRLATARWWRLINETSREEATRMVAEFRRAVLCGRYDEAVALANAMLSVMPPQPWSEPLPPVLASEAHRSTEWGQGEFTGAESPYWAQALLAEVLPKPPRRGGLEGFAAAARETLQRVEDHARGGNALAVAEHFRLAGWLAAAIEPRAGEWPAMVTIRWGTWTGLIRLPDQILAGRQVADVFDPAVREELELPSDEPDGIVLLVPVRTADFQTRNQIVGDILRQGNAHGCPTLGESPTLYFQLFKALSKASANERVDWRPVFR